MERTEGGADVDIPLRDGMEWRWKKMEEEQKRQPRMNLSSLIDFESSPPENPGHVLRPRYGGGFSSVPIRDMFYAKCIQPYTYRMHNLQV